MCISPQRKTLYDFVNARQPLVDTFLYTCYYTFLRSEQYHGRTKAATMFRFPISRAQRSLFTASAIARRSFMGSTRRPMFWMNAYSVRMPIMAPNTPVNRYMSSFSESLTSDEVAMHINGLADSSSEHDVVRNYLPEITEKIKSFQGVLSPQNMYDIMFGLQGMDSEHEEVQQLLEALLSRLKDSKETYSAAEMGILMFGMQGLRSEQEVVLRLMKFFEEKMKSSVGSPHAEAVVDVLYGMQNLSTDVSAVREFLAVVADFVDKCEDEFSADDIGFFLCGMQRMNSEVESVRRLLKRIILEIGRCDDQFEDDAILHSMQCFREMNSDQEEVIELLGLLGKKLQECGEIKTRDVTNILSCLKKLKTDRLEVRTIVSNITERLNSPTSSEFSAEMIYECLEGIISMSTQHQEVKDLVNTLQEKIAACTEQLDPEELSYFISGPLSGFAENNPDAGPFMSFLHYTVHQASNVKRPDHLKEEISEN